MRTLIQGGWVVGYDGRGGKEYFTKEFGFPVAPDDIIGYASTVERVLSQVRTDPQPLMEMAYRASEHVRNVYSPSNEERDIVAVWEQILQIPTLPAVQT